MSTSAVPAPDYQLDDRYRADSGQVYLNGMQALVRLLLMQRRRDRLSGLSTSGFVSGYRGSPLGALDLALWNAALHLQSHDIRFQPAINEDLAATAIWGTQQASLLQPTRDGVFALWYGKGPGVDRSCDALKHGNYAGTSRHGGVLVVAGDDPGAKSSSLPHQSESALINCGIPVLAPSDLQELIDLGFHGWTMSRYSGCWIGLKCVTDLLDSSETIDADLQRISPTIPNGGNETDRWIKWTTPPLALEKSLYGVRYPALHRYVRTNQLDRVAFGSARPHHAIVTSGKTYNDVRQALARLGIDRSEAERLGLGIYKLALIWPVEPEGLKALAAGLNSLLVIEEKRPVIEEQIASLLYGRQAGLTLSGKRDGQGKALIPIDGELTPDRVIDALTRWLARPAKSAPAMAATAGTLQRLPAFCSGCPHNISTKVPEGSYALAGIGCHGMALMVPGRSTLAYTHMGAEGSNWIGISPFSKTDHVFQNLGDGTYTHSGVLAIRAAVAAGVNITYKILINGAVAMTGGQPVEGHAELDVTGVTESIAHQLVAEGVKRIVVVTDYPERLSSIDLPASVTIHSRNQLDLLQREMRQTSGVTALLYDQACAAEKRRLRKRGRLADPDRRLYINEAICDGCGDCNTQSNCIAVEPLETELGRKRKINQDACNKDYSCLNGYCPSFAVIDGAQLRSRATTDDRLDGIATVDLPAPLTATGTHHILITGIGGSGVVTVGALLGMAAHLDGRGCKILDQTGGAQKNGAVTSHVHIADRKDELHAARIAQGAATLVIGCDLVTAASPDAVSKMALGQTQVIANRNVAPTAQFAAQSDLDFNAAPLEATISARVGEEALTTIEAKAIAQHFLADELGVNLLLIGIALQKGMLPVSLNSLLRAIELNGIKVEFNKRALALGRLCAHDADKVHAQMSLPAQLTQGNYQQLDQLMQTHQTYLSEYQNAAYAERYRRFVETVAATETSAVGRSGSLTESVAKAYFKLLAYKDEYEVARLWTDSAWRRRLDELFEPGYRIHLSLAPQLRILEDKRTGRVAKRLWGTWIFQVMRILAALRVLRGTPLDLWGYHPHRRRERALIAWYEMTVNTVCATLKEENYQLAVEIASIPDAIRGFGPVKERAIDAAEQRERELIARYQGTSPLMHDTVKSVA